MDKDIKNWFDISAYDIATADAQERTVSLRPFHVPAGSRENIERTGAAKNGQYAPEDTRP